MPRPPRPGPEPGTVAPPRPAAAAAPEAIRIVIAHDQADFRAELRTLLEGEPDFRVVGEASSPDDVVAVCEATLPHVLLLDVGMSGGTGLDVLERLRPLRLAARILMLTTGLARPDLVRTLQLGAYGVVLRETPAVLLFKSIRRVRAGEFWVGRDMVADLVKALSAGTAAPAPAPVLNAPRAFALTPRELEIVGAVAGGYTDQQMGEKFGVGEEAVKSHLDSILQKTGVANRLELALFAIHHRLTQPAR
jgi:two-component system, NarL family, nitrate/nitrite response regulator NarL